MRTRYRATQECLAAEDYLGSPGTPVYAISEGEISFSGTARGYGWLIIIDNPQANLYSLYGHLSPSRWQAKTGPVQKGELIGYLGEDDENGGSSEQPLLPHLHFGIRAGQTKDYPGTGEWRWQAGWIAICPQDSGWQQPSLIIANQQIPDVPNVTFVAEEVFLHIDFIARKPQVRFFLRKKRGELFRMC